MTLHQSEKIADLYVSIVDDGIEAGVERYEGMANRYRFAEFEMNFLGYQLMGTGQLDAAVAVLELNVAAFPNAFNTYDSLGEAYMEKGNYAKAVSNYRKSLQLNPNNTNAERMIQRMDEMREAN